MKEADSVDANRSSAATPWRRFTGVRLLTDNDEAWQAKRHLIATARRTLDLCYFIVELDGSTARLLLDLVAAAQRGVKVRLLVDYFLTFEQAPALRALAAVPNIEVRRFAPPTPAWLVALQAAGIDGDGFVKALMAADARKMTAALKGNTIFPSAVTDAVDVMKPEPDESAVGFPIQMLAALGLGSAGSAADPLQALAAAGAASDRAAALRQVALVIEILRGMKQYMHRTHHKLLLADGDRFIMGGRNLADAYQCTVPLKGRAFRDADIMACEQQASGNGGNDGSGHGNSFQALWDSAQAADVTAPDPLDNRPPVALAGLQAKAFDAPPAASRDGLFDRGVMLPDMDGQLFDNMPSDKGDATITWAYVRQLEQLIARGQPAVVDIVTAYLFLLDDATDSAALWALRQGFESAVQAGITVNIYTNSLASTDLRPVNQAAYPKLVALLDRGVRVFELDGGQGSLHAKCAAIGNDVLVIGSYNMDPRSELYDTNNLIVLREPSGSATATLRALCIEAYRWTRLTAASARERAARTTPAPGARLVQGLL